MDAVVFDLVFPSGRVPLRYDDGTLAARAAFHLLCVGEEWAHLCLAGTDTTYVKWTVIERDNAGLPVQVMAESLIPDEPQQMEILSAGNTVS
jgi:hypothetical protein